MGAHPLHCPYPAVELDLAEVPCPCLEVALDDLAALSYHAREEEVLAFAE